MTLIIESAIAEIYKPGNDDPRTFAPDYTIPSGTIESAEESQRIDEFKDTGKFVFGNDRGDLAGVITSGDMIRFLVNVEGTNDLEHRFTAMARNVRYKRDGPGSGTVTVEVGDFVGEVLASRRISLVRENRQISVDQSDTSPTEGIINDVVRRRCPEISTQNLPEFEDLADVYLEQENVKTVVDGLAAQAGALVWGDGIDLLGAKIDSVSPEFAVTSADITGSYQYDINDDELSNSIRVDGGDNYREENMQMDVTGYEDVTEENPITFAYRTRKSHTDRIELWTRSIDANSGDVTIRLQAPNDDNTGPIDPSDTSSDVVSKKLNYEFLSHDDFTEFIFSTATETALPERNVWAIVEGTGDTQIGVNDDGTPAFVQSYPFPLVAELPDTASIAEYRQRDYHERDNSLRSREAVRNRLGALIDNRADPDEVVTVEAESERMHHLEPGEAVDLTRENDALDGRFIVLDRADSFDGIHLTTSLELQEVNTI